MLITRGLTGERKDGPGCAVAIGNFDGLHLGHQAILAGLARRAAELRLPQVVLTFEPHPKEFFTPEQAPARLMRLRDKAEWLAAAGIERLAVLRFGAQLSGWDAGEFVERVLERGLGARQVVVGAGFRFGKGRGGDVALLQAAGIRRGFGVDGLAALELGGSPVSSTRIRAALAAGRLDAARALLGRDYRISGRVIEGEKLGRRIGFPTANMKLLRDRLPLAGVFAVRVSGVGSDPQPGVASLGTRPTIGGTEPLLEAHVFDFDGDLYGRRLAVDFVARLRDEVRFPDLDAMVRQMHEDARAARALLGC